MADSHRFRVSLLSKKKGERAGYVCRAGVWGGWAPSKDTPCEELQAEVRAQPREGAVTTVKAIDVLTSDIDSERIETRV